METANKHTSDYEAIMQTLQNYIDGSLAGKSQLMQTSFHADATIYGYYRGNLVSGAIQKLYDLIDGNGPAPDIQPHFASIEILHTIAVVRLEVAHWTGKVIGSDTHMTDLFTLIKTAAGWKISHKIFHLH
jgi:hypothetical protein